MPATTYRFHSIEADGPWTSEPFPPAERRHIVQGVIGGYIMGRPRWAEDLDGNFIYGLDSKGKEMKSAPSASAAGSRHHATKKKSSAQLDREIEAFLQGRVHAPSMSHAIPDRGYMVAQHGGGTYLSSFGSKDEAVRFARGLARQTREAYDIVKVQNRGEDRFIVDEIAPPGRAHATKKPHILTEEGRLADLQLQGFMKRGPMRTWIVAVEAPSGDPSEATYVEVQGKTEAAALRAAQARKPGRKLTVRYAK